MKLHDAEVDMHVAYVPDHARGDINHRDVEYGQITKITIEGMIFVRFDGERHSKACYPRHLRRVYALMQDEGYAEWREEG